MSGSSVWVVVCEPPGKHLLPDLRRNPEHILDEHADELGRDDF